MARRETTQTAFSEALETANKVNIIEKEVTETVVEDNSSEQFSGLLKQVFAEKPKKKTGKTYSFYLEEEVHEKLEETAGEQGISTSKVLNEILKTIYNIK